MPEATETNTNAAATTAEKPEEAAKMEVPPSEPVKQTRSIVLSGFGGPKYVRVQSKEQSVVGKGEIAIEVDACGVNFTDIMTRQGLIENLGKPPFVMGSECCGKVSEVGEGVTSFKVGDEVIVLCDGGAWTERLVVTPFTETEASVVTTPSATATTEGAEPEAAANAKVPAAAASALVLRKPAHLNVNQAAVAMMAYVPAYLLLHRLANVQAGDIVLVHSAGGGIGTALGQLVKLIPDVKLIGTASAGKHEKLGAYYSHIISHSQDYVAEIKKLYPQGLTVVLDCLSAEDTSKAIALLQPMGRYIVYGSSNFVTGDRKNLFSFAKSWLQMDRISPLKLLEENKVMGGFALKPMIFKQHANLKPILDAWKELTNLFSQKKIEPIVDSEWSFEEVKEAMQKLQDRQNFGKLVISPKLKPKVPETEEKKTEEKEAAKDAPS